MTESSCEYLARVTRSSVYDRELVRIFGVRYPQFENTHSREYIHAYFIHPLPPHIFFLPPSSGTVSVEGCRMEEVTEAPAKKRRLEALPEGHAGDGGPGTAAKPLIGHGEGAAGEKHGQCEEEVQLTVRVRDSADAVVVRVRPEKVDLTGHRGLVELPEESGARCAFGSSRSRVQRSKRCPSGWASSRASRCCAWGTRRLRRRG